MYAGTHFAFFLSKATSSFSHGQILKSHGKKGEGRGGEPSHQWWYAKIEAQSEYVHVACTSLHIWRQFWMLSRCFAAKFLRRSSVRSLLRVRCWLGRRGRSEREKRRKKFFFWKVQLFLLCVLLLLPPFPFLSFLIDPDSLLSSSSSSSLQRASWSTHFCCSSSSSSC